MSKIITAGNPILKMKAEPVRTFGKKLRPLLEDMKKTLYEADGTGLAAPQIGVSLRICVIDDGNGFDEYLNPVITPIGEEKATDTEGCLSIPGLCGEVERYAKVRVDYQDRHGKHKSKEATELLARCLQHETDHLDGILFIEKAISLRKNGRRDE